MSTPKDQVSIVPEVPVSAEIEHIIPPDYSLTKFVLYFLRLGTTGFGGPIALAAKMRATLVDDRGWISHEEYMEGLALAQLAPGPLASQLAMFLGWIRSGALGASLVGTAFILPSLLMVVALSAVYVHYGGLSWMQGVFYGVGAAVIAIISVSAWKLVKLTTGIGNMPTVLMVISMIATVWARSEVVVLIVASGVVNLAYSKFPKMPGSKLLSVPVWLISGLHGAAQLNTVVKILLYFGAAGSFVFGSGLAIVPFMHGGVVQHYRWLTENEFLDAVAIAMITPGPVIITVAFIGYLVAGPVGALAAATGVFLPCYGFVIIPARYFRKMVKNVHVKAFAVGVTAAATGAIAGAVVVLGMRAIVDIPTLLIALSTLVILLKFKKVPEPIVIVAAGLIGISLRGHFN